MSVSRKMLLAALSGVLMFSAPSWALSAPQKEDENRPAEQQKEHANEATGEQDRANADRDKASQNDKKDDQRDAARQNESDRQRDHADHDARNRDGQSAHRDEDSQGGLGVFISDTRSGGVEVERVVPNSPAHQAGLREGDRILSVNNERVNSAQQLTQLISQQEPGSQVNVDLIRNGEHQQIRAQLASREQAVSQRITRATDNDHQRRYSNDDNHTQGRYQRGQWADQDQFGSRDHSGNLEHRLSRLENNLNRLSQQIERLQNQLEGRDGAVEYRTRDRQNDGRDRDRQVPKEERQDSELNRDF